MQKDLEKEVKGLPFQSQEIKDVAKVSHHLILLEWGPSVGFLKEFRDSKERRDLHQCLQKL